MLQGFLKCHDKPDYSVFTVENFKNQVCVHNIDIHFLYVAIKLQSNSYTSVKLLLCGT